MPNVGAVGIVDWVPSSLVAVVSFVVVAVVVVDRQERAFVVVGHHQLAWPFVVAVDVVLVEDVEDVVAVVVVGGRELVAVVVIVELVPVVASVAAVIRVVVVVVVAEVVLAVVEVVEVAVMVVELVVSVGQRSEETIGLGDVVVDSSCSVDSRPTWPSRPSSVGAYSGTVHIPGTCPASVDR